MDESCLNQLIKPIVLVQSIRLSELLGVQLVIATETFQPTGSVKFRGACSIVTNVATSAFITVSSGNFGIALAHTCRLLSKRCSVVMPQASSQYKIQATLEEGARVELASSPVQQRALVTRLSRPGVYVVRAKEDPFVLSGYVSLGEELAKLDHSFDVLVAPVGGGGVISGIIEGLNRFGKRSSIVGAEPLMANDASSSFKQGRLIRLKSEPQTIADGARALSLGTHCWEVIRHGLSNVVEVPEEAIKEGMRILFCHANLKVEPTGALALGAVLAQPALFRNKSVCCLITGKNVDAALFSSVVHGRR